MDQMFGDLRTEFQTFSESTSSLEESIKTVNSSITIVREHSNPPPGDQSPAQVGDYYHFSAQDDLRSEPHPPSLLSGHKAEHRSL
jgi:hypothetical protein